MILTDIIQERLIFGTIGAASGIIISIKTFIINMIFIITMKEVIETIILTVVGTLTGLLIRELWRYGRKCILKLRNKNK